MPEIQMPKLSDTMTEGTLVAWKKKKGDKVSTGDVIASRDFVSLLFLPGHQRALGHRVAQLRHLDFRHGD